MPSAATSAEPELGAPLDVVRYFIAESRDRGHHPVVAVIVILGGETGVRALLTRVLDAASP